MTIDPRCASWKFPFKPVRVPETTVTTLDHKSYTMEAKWDGWRAIVVQSKKPSLWTREKRMIEMPANLEQQLTALNLPEGTVLDGEIWNPLKRGSWRHNSQVKCQLTLWDAVRVGHKDISLASIEDRRNELNSLLTNAGEDIRMVQVLDASVEEFNRVLEETKVFRADNALRSGFIHGVVFKKKGSPRRDHATRCVEHSDWLKVVFHGMKGWEPRG